MGISDEIFDVIEQRLFLKTKRRRIAFYVFFAMVSILIASMVLSIWYADSLNPLSLFKEEDNIFFSGSSGAVFVNSSGYLWCDTAGESTITIIGRSTIDIYPKSDIYFTSEGGENRTVKEPVRITSSPDSVYGVYIPGSYIPGSLSHRLLINNTHFYFTDIILDFQKENSHYNLYLNRTGVKAISFDDILNKSSGTGVVYNLVHSINQVRGTFNIQGPGDPYNFKGFIMYIGTINISTPDRIITTIPVISTNILPVKELTINEADGNLTVGHKNYKCGRSDFIYINPRKDCSFFLKDGTVYINGYAKSLKLNDVEIITNPIDKLMKEKYYFVLIGLLAGILILFLRKILAEIKK